MSAFGGFGDVLRAILNRAGQQAQATRQGTLGLGPDPNAGRSLHYGDIPVLGGALRVPVTALQATGLVQEGAGEIGKMATGTTGAALGALQAALNSPYGGAVTALAHTVPVVGSVADAMNLGQHLGPLNPMEAGPLKSADAQRALAAFLAHPGPQGQLAANEALAQGNQVATGAANMALNPLNWVGGLGELGAGMRAGGAAVDALGGLATTSEPAAIRALGAALQGGAKLGELANAPAAALFSGAWRGIRGGPMAGLTAAAHELGAGRLRGIGEAIANPTGPLEGMLNAPATVPTAFADPLSGAAMEDMARALAGAPAPPPPNFPQPPPPTRVFNALSPTKTAVPAAAAADPVAALQAALGGAAPLPPPRPPTVVRPAPQAFVPRMVRPAPQENLPRLVRAAPQTGVPALLPPEVYTREPTFTSGPASLLQEAAQRLGVTARPSQAPNTIGDLQAAIANMTPAPAVSPAAAGGTTPWEDFVSSTAATYRSPALPPVSEALSASQGIPEDVAPAAMDWADRTGVIRQAANAPLTHLTSILADLHNALYPGQRADFAIPALTGQPKAAFRTSFLLDQPGQNRAEPYLDYLVNRVQHDSKAAARLADINPTLADDVAQLAHSDLAPAEHKALIQSLFKGVGETPAPAAAATDVATAAAGVAPGTLDDFNALLAGPWSRSMYVPDAAAFARRLNVPEAQAQAWIDDATRAGTLTRSPQGDLTFAPRARPAGGDIAAGGGGGDGLGLLPPRLAQTAAGGLAGAGVGAGIGAATDEDNRLRGALKGAGIGALVGGNVGAVSPELAAVARTVGPGLGAVAGLGLRAQKRAFTEGAVFPTGERALVGYVRALKKTFIGAVGRNTLGAAGNIAAGHGSFAGAGETLATLWQALPKLLPDVEAAGRDEAARNLAVAKYLPDAVAGYDLDGLAMRLKAGGAGFDRSLADLGAANVNPFSSAGLGAALAHVDPVKGVVMGPFAGAAGALEGFTLPGRVAAQQGILTPFDIAARDGAFAAPIYKDLLARDAPAFIAKATAVDPSLAGTLDAAGKFGATDILGGAAKPPAPIQALADEWRAIQQRAADVSGAATMDAMGNFADQTKVGTWLGVLFPGGSWNVQQAAVVARAMAMHPALALTGLAQIREDYEEHLRQGDPEKTGTWRITDQTPGVGLIARAATGGGPGQYDVNLAYPFSPIGGEILDLPRQLDPRYSPGTLATDKALKVASALGLALNPEVGALLYKEGVVQAPPSSPLRLEPAGHALDTLLAPSLRYANPGARLFAQAGQADPVGDAQTALRMGRYLDPGVAQAGAELIFEQTNRPASDPRNAQFLAELRDPGSPLHQEAVDRSAKGQLAQALLSETAPAPGQAATETAADVRRAQTQLFQQGIPFTKAQVQALASGDRVTASMALQEAMDSARLGNSLLRVNDAATPEAQAASLMDDWKRRFSGLQLFPAVYQQALAQQGERLGTVPAGTAAATQALYDALLAGQRPGPVPVWPGGPPPQFDPSPIYQLQDYFNRGGR